MNVSGGGEVCIGTADIPSNHDIDTQAAWEAIVFATNFAHVNHQQTVRLADTSQVGTERHLAFWQELDNKRQLPVPALNPMEMTLRKWLDRVLR